MADQPAAVGSKDSPYYYGAGGTQPIATQPSAVGSADSPYYYGGGGLQPQSPSAPSGTGAGLSGGSGDQTNQPWGSDLLAPRSLEDLQKLAAAQIDASIKGQTDPLRSQIDILGGRETNAIQQIGSLFSGLQPYVSGEADKVQSAYETAFNASQAIFNTAQQRMNQLKQDRAADAQAMAQKIGGPVAVGEFTASVLPQMEELASTAPNSLLHMLADAQAGTQEARAFSEQVFPLMRTEQEAKARGYFEDQIKSLNDQITSINSQRQGLATDKLNDMIKDERTFQLNQKQYELDKLKSDRDWKASQHSLHNEDQRIKQTQQQINWQKTQEAAQLSGTYKGKATLAALKVDAETKAAAARANISQASLNERIRHNLESEKAQQQRLAKQGQSNAMKIIDAAMNPSKRATLTLQSKQYIDPKTQAILQTQAVTGQLNDAHYDQKKKQWYYYAKRTMTPQQAIAQGYPMGGNTPVRDPQKLYDILTASHVPAADALKAVRIKTGIGDFQPGVATDYNTETLANMTNKQLMEIARARGYKGSGSRNDLIHYIQLRNPNQQATPAGWNTAPTRP